tara:strand:- start:591 stop:830 length:240 start_codon:yes stop_codon:yes gene_type:complete
VVVAEHQAVHQVEPEVQVVDLIQLVEQVIHLQQPHLKVIQEERVTTEDLYLSYQPVVVEELVELDKVQDLQELLQEMVV